MIPSGPAARRATRLIAAAMAAAGLIATPGCRDDGDPLGLEGLHADFTADDPDPAPLSLSLARKDASGPVVEVGVFVTGFELFFGAAFHVTFDPARAEFAGYSSSGSFIAEDGAAVDIRAQLDPSDPSRVLVVATRQGQFAGVDAVGSRPLLGLLFRAPGPEPGTPIAFGDAATRRVVTCPAPPAACTTLGDGDLHWSSGTLSAN